MRIVIASDKFKGSLSAVEACEAIAAGVRRAKPQAEVDLCPMSDGGEGFVDAMCRAREGRHVTHRVVGPLPEMRVDAAFALLDDTAVIEMASASGLALLAPADRNPLYTTTFGAGQLIHHAVDLGCREILLGIGGSATCDAGLGCLQACGCHVILKNGEYATPTEPLCGRDMDDVLMIKSHRGSRVDGVEITIACDVTNPLYGPTGSAHVYGPQKGASPADVQRLDRMLESLATRLGWTEIALRPGSGAAGGIGCGLAAMFNARLVRGVDLAIAATRLRDRIVRADLVLTGEGTIDASSAYGKTTLGVLNLAQELGKPCHAIAGRVEADIGFTKTASLVDAATDADAAMRNASQLLAARTSALLRADS